MTKFKVGDKVKCIGGAGCGITIGAIYTLTEVSHDGECIYFIDEDGDVRSRGDLENYVLANVYNDSPVFKLERNRGTVKLEVTGKLSKDKVRDILNIVFD